MYFTSNRKTYRLPFRTKFVFAHRERVFTGNSINISAGGMFVGCQETLPRETLCKVLFLLGDETPPIFTEALVKRVATATPDPEDIPGLGFQFVHNNSMVNKEIEDFVENMRRHYELTSTILGGGEPDLTSLSPLLKQMHLPPFADLGELRMYVERVLNSIEVVERSNRPSSFSGELDEDDNS